MRILFLDIDGVLNSYQSANMRQSIIKNSGFVEDKHMNKDAAQGFLDMYYHDGSDMCPLAVSNLERILIEHSDLKIVISSSWRLGEEMKDIKGWFKYSRVIPERIIDTTPVLKNAPRGDEIRRWALDNWRFLKDFVVLDDEDDMDSVEDHLIQVDTKVGLDWNKATEVINFLNRSPHERL